MSKEKKEFTHEDFGVSEYVYLLGKSMFEFEYPHDESWNKRQPGDVAKERYLRLAEHAQGYFWRDPFD